MIIVSGWPKVLHKMSVRILWLGKFYRVYLDIKMLALPAV